MPLAGSGLPPGSTVALAELSVTVVPPVPVHLQLAFDSTSLTVTAGAAATVVVSLPGVPEVTPVVNLLDPGAHCGSGATWSVGCEDGAVATPE